MDTNTLIALSVLTDYLQKKKTLIHETLELLQKIPKPLDPETQPEDIDPPCRMPPANKPTLPENNYTYEQVRSIFTAKSSSGQRVKMKAILASHNLQKLSDAKENQQLLNRLAMEAEAVQNA